jgi:cytidyltransferase-like protein
VTVFAAGCFNRVHQAHASMLRTARSLGDELVVVLSHDAHNKKTNARPAADRLRDVQALNIADRVVVGDPDSFANSLRRERPDILVLGYDQRLPDLETEKVVKELGLRVVVMPWMPGKQQDCDPRLK